MSRTIIVTGAGSGIGKATAEILRAQGHTVIGLDLRGSDIDVDLSNAESLAHAVEAVKAQCEVVDGIVANAGVTSNSSLDLKVNYFGAVDTIEAFKPMLEKSDAPRVAVTASAASLQPTDTELVGLLLADDREGAFARGDALAAQDPMIGYANYSASKRAIATWVRRVAPTEEYAGKGIAINAVGPGVVKTAMTEQLLSTEEGRAMALGAMPAPLNGPVEAAGIGNVLAFLVSAENASMTGQIIYVDGGFDALPQGRGEDLWHSPKHIDG